MKVVDWRKGLILWFQDKAEILEYHNTYVHSQLVQFRLPSVLKLKKFVKKSIYHRIRFCRENIYLRDDHACQYCGHHFDKRDLTLDHVLPASKGGPKTWTNVVTSCRPCNQRKGNRTPQQARMPLLKLPVEPLWLPPKELILTAPGPQVWAEYLLLLSNRSA